MSGTLPTPTPPTPGTIAWNAPQALITYFTLALIVGCLAIAYLKADTSTIELIVGAALGWAGASITFWMGSSHSSQAKDAVIAAQVTKPTTTVTTGAGTPAQQTTTTTGVVPPTTTTTTTGVGTAAETTVKTETKP